MARYRLYYNRSVDWPQCWSVDEGDQSTEFNVQGFEIRGALVRDGVLPSSARGLEGAAPVLPTAWCVVEGELQVIGGSAIFTPCSSTP